MDIAISIAVTVLLTLVNGYFSMSEMALSTAKKVVLDHEAEEGDRKAATAAAVIDNPGDFLATIQVAITLVGFASSAFAATSLSEPLGDLLASWNIPMSRGLATVLITLVLSYFSIVVGELVPKRIAMADAEGVSKRVAGPLLAFSSLAKPLVWLTAASANGLATLLRIKGTDDRQNVSEDEIRYMVTDADELTDQEKSMIHDVIDLGDAVAREVMVPRVDVEAVEDITSCSEVLTIMRRTGFSRLPVYHEDVDRITGIAHIKDLITPVLDEGAADERVSRYLRQAKFVPETKDIFPLLSEMQAGHEQMAIVVDEYGGTAGIITIEDIVEEVVGEIEDEFDPDNRFLNQVSDREWLVDGRYSIDDAIELGWPIEDNAEYETIAGFVLELADRLPRPGDKFEKDGYQFIVQSMRGRRLAMLRVIAPPSSEEDEPVVESRGILSS
ncbi:MAG: HlyC/CorC family transporter [Atopobiaceae bacterium]|nr:HlyC/CorC family transporter [Atopobiaceae bacterium]